MKVAKVVVDIITVLAMFFLLFMFAVVISNVVMRYVFTSPINGAPEISQMMLICLVSSTSCALLRGNQVWIDVLSQKFSRKATIVLDILTMLTSSAVFIFISVGTFTQMLSLLANGRQYTMLKLPFWPFYAVLAVALLIFAVAILIYMVDRLITYAKGGTPVNAFSLEASRKTIEQEISEKYDGISIETATENADG